MNQQFLDNIDKIHSRSTEDFGSLIYSLCKAIRPGVVVETGTCQGYMTAWLALAAIEFKFKFYSIDYYSEGYPHASPGSIVNVENNLRMVGVESGVELIIGEALQTLQNMVKSNKLDNLCIVVLDDHHIYHHLRTEIDTVINVLVPGGMILVHDVCHECVSGVYHAVQDSIKHYNLRNLWFFRSLGYCIMQKGW